MKKLYIHIGLSKTGSSAIQSWLSLNVSKLSKKGFDYADLSPSAKEGKITAGNGVMLFHACNSENWEEAERLILSVYFKNNKKAIISSETLQNIAPLAIKKINDICQKHDISVKVIAYARSVYELLYSNYLQGVKRHGFTFRFGEKEGMGYKPQRRFLENYNKVFDKNFQVLNYDSCKGNIYNSFAQLLGIKANKFVVKNKKVNRSLTFVESEVLRKMNELHKGVFSTEISDYLINMSPELSTAVFYDDELLEKTKKHATEDLNWINDNLIHNNDFIKLDNSNSSSALLNSEEDDEEKILNEVVKWALDKKVNNQVQEFCEFLCELAVFLSNDYLDNAILIMEKAKKLHGEDEYITSLLTMFNNKKNKPSVCNEVAVLAVIKDESVYIHEWIHHYHHFGFKHIYLAVNRTSDRTIEVLDRICEKYESVKYFITDWIDKDSDESGINPNMQRLSYSFLANEVFKDKNVTHCLSLDADEFFYPKCFKKSIKEFISSFPDNEMLSIHWACQGADKEGFLPPFANDEYYIRPQVKTLISRSAYTKVKKFTVHVPLLSEENGLHIDASGLPFVPGKHREISSTVFSDNQKAFILHRMIRSDLEYLALLLRQRPASTLRLKNNRNGIVKKGGLLNIEIPKDILNSYYESLNSFITRCNLLDILVSERDEIKERAKLVLDVNDEDICKDIETYYTVLNGTSAFPALHERMKALGNGLLKMERPVDRLRDLAIHMERFDLNVSLDLMKIALIGRPKGVIIQRKVISYESKLKKGS
ncbi:glycosyltransferase family 2 protein [uncultured Psychromonas sp.]|uniref:glycosyltransferase family 2 protein n=1 Tax=uncultured Psychromonas sp. TaxID=173974 RepID=UPI00261A06EE|nr:glycosyltransferase family 2 protein [uncultured Psychromonas sp.]